MSATLHKEPSESPEEYIKRQYDYSDPNRLGRGVWYMWMIMSVEAQNKEERLVACRFMRGFCYKFKCGKCHGHCNKYFTDNPPEDHVETTDMLFDWIVKFMSAVNVRTGRPPYDRNILYKIVSDEDFMVCSEDCGAEDKPFDEAKFKAAAAALPDKIPIVPGPDNTWIKQASTMFPGLITSAKQMPKIQMLPRNGRK